MAAKRKSDGLRKWFSRNSGKGWIDCKTGKPCGRKSATKSNQAAILKYVAGELKKCELGDTNVMGGDLKCSERSRFKYLAFELFLRQSLRFASIVSSIFWYLGSGIPSYIISGILRKK